MDLHLGDIVLIEIPFHQRPGAKIRPAIALPDSKDGDFVAVPLTSKDRVSEYDLTLSDWKAAGLNVPSTVRIHKVAVLPKAHVRQHIGRLSRTDLAAVREALLRAFCS